MKKRSIIVLHGWGLSGKRFNGLVEALSALKYTVYAPDLPGFGDSEIPEFVYTLTDYCDFLDRYIQTNHIDHPVLIGHSFGGRVSLKYVQMHPEKISALILTGAPGFTPVPGMRLKLFIMVAKIGKFISSIWPLSVIQDFVRSRYYYAVGARDYYRANGVMRDIFKKIVQEDLMASMMSVRIPCALLWGELDRITPLWIAKKMNKIIQNSTLTVIPQSDHGVSFKQPELFANEVQTILAAL
jgi:pimeloyl-ACP methyl ester carboxylesterase